MTTPRNHPKSDGLGGTVFEFPQGAKRPAPETPPETDTPKAHTLNLLKHLPEGDFKQYVGDVAKMCNIYSSTSLLVAIGIVSSVACRSFGVAYQNEDVLPVGEYIICGGLPGDAKSRMLKAFQRPVFEAQKEADKAWKQRKEAHENSEAEGRFDEPRPPRIFITDSTVEALESVLAESGGYFSLASAEQAVVNTLIGASYGGKDKKNNNDLPLKGFNAEHHAGARAGKDRVTFNGKVVGSIMCFAQPAAVETIYSNSEGSGMAERFIVSLEQTQQGIRDHTRPHYPQEYSQNVYNRIMKDMAAQVLTLAQDFDDLQAYRIRKDDWRKIYLFRNEIEPHLADGGKYSTSTMRGFASKVDMHIMKIAALLAYLYEHPVGEIPSQFIDAAINIMKDMLDNTLSLLFKIGVLGFDAEEDCLIEYMGKCNRVSTRRQVVQSRKGVKPFTEAKSASSAVQQTIDRLLQKGVFAESEEFDASGNSKGKLLRMVA
jgi:hypothetical protein